MHDAWTGPVSPRPAGDGLVRPVVTWLAVAVLTISLGGVAGVAAGALPIGPAESGTSSLP